MSDGDDTWAALFERAPGGVTVADVRAALAERRGSREAGAGDGNGNGEEEEKERKEDG